MWLGKWILPRATVRRSLLTLAHLGYVKEEGRLFSLAPRVLQLAAAYLGASHAAAILQPGCERLAAEYGETFSVAALDGDSAVMIAYATPRRMYMDAPGIGLRLPAYCSAVGRVLLAALPQGERENFWINFSRKPSHRALSRIRGNCARSWHASRPRALRSPMRKRGWISFARSAGAPGGRYGWFRVEHRHACRAPLRRIHADELPATAAS